MTDTLAPVSGIDSAPTRLRVTAPRVVLSEWTKFRSLRSTVYTLLMAVVFMIGLGAMITAITANQPGGFEPGESSVSLSLSGMFFAQLAIGVLGVLLITGEYSTGMIRSSLTVVPRRLPMLWGEVGGFRRSGAADHAGRQFRGVLRRARRCSVDSSWTRRCPTRVRCGRWSARRCT